MIMCLKNNALIALSASLLVALMLPGVYSNPYIIADARIRNLDVSPVLGRGYSIMTNSFQSTCLVVDQTTVPSYNYDYSFYDFSTSTDVAQDSSRSISSSFGYSRFSASASSTSSSSSSSNSQERNIVASMRLERYYSSVREEVTPLGADATALIAKQDYVGFFNSCGPTYVRGIRRAQEVFTMFKFKSLSNESASAYASTVSAGWSRNRVNKNRNSSSTQSSESQSLSITILGYGMGLSQDGSEALIAQNLEDFQQVMKFAFHSMTRASDSHHIGMVYGMEIVPWVENTAFQVASNVQDEVIEIPVLLSLIPRAYEIGNVENLNYDNTDAASRARFKCKEAAYMKDKFGYCCEINQLYNATGALYQTTNPHELVCRPMRMLDPVFIKDNMAANGEFVARLNRSVNYKLNQLFTLERCISAVREIPEMYAHSTLKAQDTVEGQGIIDIAMTVKEMQTAMDPFDDYGMVKQMARELDEFLEMYISPCYAALFGGNISLTPDTDISFFFAYPWHSHKECTKLSCLGNSVRWDRSNPRGGCVASMIQGPASPGFKDGTGFDQNCLKETREGSNGLALVCKHDTDAMDEFHTKAKQKWEKSVPRGQIDYFLEMFCMPQITGDIIPDEARDAMDVNVAPPEVVSINIAKGKPAEQSSEGWDGKARYAVDGNTSGTYGHRSVSHTHNNNPWWQVTLHPNRMQKIKKIVIYRRTDCCHGRINGAIVSIINTVEGEVVREWTLVEQDRMEFEVPGGTVEGNRVRVFLPRTSWLHLAEVEVYAMVPES